jgi:hypothetical protein
MLPQIPPDLESQIDHLLAMQVRQRKNGRAAYWRILGIGPGGGMMGYITTLEEDRGDLLVTIFAASDSDKYLHDSPETHDYYMRCMKSPDAYEQLMKAGDIIAEELEKTRTLEPGGAANPNQSGPIRSETNSTAAAAGSRR